MLETARILLALGLEATRMRDNIEVFLPNKGKSFRNWLCPAALAMMLGSGYGGLEERERCERKQRWREDFDFQKRKNACCCFNGGALKFFEHFCLFILI